MSDQAQGPDWWRASNGKYYPAHLHPSYRPPGVQQAPANHNGCLIALAVVGGIVVAGFVGLLALGVLFADEVNDATRVAGKDNGVSISLAEFERIENGMTLRQVNDIIGGPGALMSTAGSGEIRASIYSWDGTGGIGANANVSFQGDVVMAKAQFGLD